MIEFDLKCNQDVLAINLLLKGRLSEQLNELCWHDYPSDCELARYDFMAFLNSAKPNNPLLNTIKTSKEFGEQLSACEANLERISANLAEHKARIDKFLAKTCGVDIALPIQTVYIVALDGCNVGNNTILWGHPKGVHELHYDIVYLYHEALHSLFNKVKKELKLRDTWEFDHVLIQYLTDIELARFLTGTRYDTHAYLEHLEYKCYPYMQMFFDKPQVELKKENATSKVKIAFNKDKFTHLKKIFSDFNIIEFYKWLLNNRNDILNQEIEKHIVLT